MSQLSSQVAGVVSSKALALCSARTEHARKEMGCAGGGGLVYEHQIDGRANCELLCQGL